MLQEIKDGSKPPWVRILTADERKWHEAWGGQVATVHTPEQALRSVIEGAGLMGTSTDAA
jgi:hypothetical protein